MTEKVAVKPDEKRGEDVAEIFPTYELSEQHSRGFLSKEISLVGKNGTGRYPVKRGSITFGQLGWNRGSYISSRPLHTQGMRAFLFAKERGNCHGY
jgi:hypothetical protein